jgi:hypothetical protein
MALEVIDTFNSGELQNMLAEIKDKEPQEYGFMNHRCDLKLEKFTPIQVRYGELREYIAQMKEEGYYFMESLRVSQFRTEGDHIE